MSTSSGQADGLRTLADELRRIYEHNVDWLSQEAVTLVSSVDAMREAADAIEGMCDRLQADAPARGTCEWLPVESCHDFAGPGWECSNCGHEVGECERDFYNCCPICRAEVTGTRDGRKEAGE